MTALVVVETTIWLFMKFPSLNKSIPYFKPVVREVYETFDRDIIQFQPDCARYDSLLTYTLRPGTCLFSNREFSTAYQINSLGFRDDEHSLLAPEIIVLGDSHAMGWGVEQDETFVALVEKSTGFNTLNAGISSYGTAREALALQRLDKSNLKYLIIQYNQGDHDENKTFVENGFVLPITDKAGYESTSDMHVHRQRYKPLLYFRTLISFYKGHFLNVAPVVMIPAVKAANSVSGTGQQSSEEQAHYFLEILSRLKGMDHVLLIILKVEGRLTEDRYFENALAGLLRENEYPPFIEQAQILYCADFLTREDYFILDDHLTKAGHRKIAAGLARLISEK